MFTMKNKVRFSEVDHEKKMTIPAVINYFQDLSIFQSESLGLGFQLLESRHRAWMLSSWQVVLNRRPALLEDITVNTWATGFKGLYGTRNFTMVGGEGQTAAYANSIWVYMDMKKGRPVKPENDEIEAYGTEAALEMEYAQRKIELPKESRQLASFPVRKYHIDTNMHVNNAVYVQMALELMEDISKICQVRVDYRRAAVYGDVIFPSIAKEEDRTVVKLCSGDETPFAIVEFT